jgi:hypothetical protein
MALGCGLTESGIDPLFSFMFGSAAITNVIRRERDRALRRAG